MKFRVTRSFVLFIVADIVLAGVLVFVILQTRQPERVLNAPSPAMTQAPVQSGGNAPVSPSTANLVPVNNVDPMTGNAVAYGCPVTMYKGHVIGFCCKQSPAFNGGWDEMTEAARDAFVARFVGRTGP